MMEFDVHLIQNLFLRYQVKGDSVKQKTYKKLLSWGVLGMLLHPLEPTVMLIFPFSHVWFIPENFKLVFSSSMQAFCLELKLIWMNMWATLAAEPEHPNPWKRHTVLITYQMPYSNSSFLIILQPATHKQPMSHCYSHLWLDQRLILLHL